MFVKLIHAIIYWIVRATPAPLWPSSRWWLSLATMAWRYGFYLDCGPVERADWNWSWADLFGNGADSKEES